MRSAQVVICSMAAARKVSAAASSTLAPSDLKRYASLAMVVVLPVPLTPTTKMTAGIPGPGMRGHGTALRSANRVRSSSCSAFCAPTSVRARARSQTSMASSAPRSAEMRASSTSSQVSSSGSTAPEQVPDALGETRARRCQGVLQQDALRLRRVGPGAVMRGGASQARIIVGEIGQLE